MSPRITLAFDVYGTLLDTSSVSKVLAIHTSITDDKALDVSKHWRRLQLEYTFRLNSMGIYEPFDVVTRRSLLHAASDFDIELPEAIVDKLCSAYWELGPFPDAVRGLRALQDKGNVDVLAFSNGTTKMIDSAFEASSISSLLPKKYLVDSVKRYKPDPEVYRRLLESLGTGDAENVWLVSGNPFDIVGARKVGMGGVWVNRDGKSWTENLTDLHPHAVVRSLEDLAGLV